MAKIGVLRHIFLLPTIFGMIFPNKKGWFEGAREFPCHELFWCRKANGSSGLGLTHGWSHPLGCWQCWQLNKTALKQQSAWNPTMMKMMKLVGWGIAFLVDMFKQSVTGLSLHGIIPSSHVLGPDVSHWYPTIRGEKGWQLHRQWEELYAVTVEGAGLSIYRFFIVDLTLLIFVREVDTPHQTCFGLMWILLILFSFKRCGYWPLLYWNLMRNWFVVFLFPLSC